MSRQTFATTRRVNGAEPSRPHAPGKLGAVVFDVDGTLVDSERMGHRVAFNEAFARFGLPDRWTSEQYGDLLEIAGGRRRLASYLLGRGLDPTDSAALADEIHRIKTTLFREMAGDGAVPLRPGVHRLVLSLQRHGVRLFVATTGQPDWVEPLLGCHFGPGTFERVLTGADVTALKPDPEVYERVLEEAGLDRSEVVAVEDSGNGLRAAHAAGVPCLVVVNEYTGAGVDGAELVVSGFGPHAARLYGEPAPLPHGLVTVETLAALVGRVPPPGRVRTGHEARGRSRLHLRRGRV